VLESFRSMQRAATVARPFVTDIEAVRIDLTPDVLARRRVNRRNRLRLREWFSAFAGGTIALGCRCSQRFVPGAAGGYRLPEDLGHD
jgi:hypothetical protein